MYTCLKTARTNNISRLYHYEVFVPDRLEQFISTQTIYCSNPRDFNDPWDCRVSLREPVDSSEIKLAAESYSQKLLLNGRPKADVDTYRQKLESDPCAIIKMIRTTEELIQNKIFSEYRIYCLSTKSTCELMWAHYGDRHQGICLEFNVDNDVFCGAIEITYQDELLTIDTVKRDIGDAAKLTLASKSKSWDYEAEYRLIAHEANSPLSEYPLRSVRNFLPIPSNSLNSIIIGCNMPECSIDKIKDIIAISKQNILLKKATRSNNKYELIINCLI
jgi:hypothetical protein